MPDDQMIDARTTPPAVWSVLENLKGDTLTSWRMADVPGRRTAEQRNLTEDFPFGWYAVCYSDELPAGTLKTVHYLSREMVVWRGEDGTARVLDAYCRHLGAHMGHGGRVSGNNLECPFHAWEYDGTGAVVRIPYARSIPPQAKRADCVKGWPVVERNGFVWIWYHPAGKAPLWEVETFLEVGSPGWTDYKKSEWRVFNSIRNMHDNGVDLAHFLYIHRTAELPQSEVTIDGQRMTTISRAKLGTPRGLVDGAIVSDNISPGHSSVRFQGISETLLVGAITPIEKDELHVRFAFTQPKEEAEGPMGGLARALIRDICKQLDQDKVVWDHQYYEKEPLLCDSDGPVPLARLRYDQFMSDEAYQAAKGKVRKFETRPKA